MSIRKCSFTRWKGNNGLTKTQISYFRDSCGVHEDSKARLTHIETDILNNFKRPSTGEELKTAVKGRN